MAHTFSVELERIIDAVADEIIELEEFGAYWEALKYAREYPCDGEREQIVINEYDEECCIVNSIIVK